MRMLPSLEDSFNPAFFLSNPLLFYRSQPPPPPLPALSSSCEERLAVMCRVCKWLSVSPLFFLPLAHHHCCFLAANLSEPSFFMASNAAKQCQFASVVADDFCQCWLTGCCCLVSTGERFLALRLKFSSLLLALGSCLHD